MRSTVRTTRSNNGIRIEVPSATVFEDFRAFREAILDRPGITTVVFDFHRATDAPTWLMGFMLHVEERHGLQVRAENVAGTPRRLFELAGLERLLCAAAPKRPAASDPVHDEASGA
ncbi:MAG: hypothetical protein H6977_04150 [Gammaproteobacteria bacterium]|nr:hypothetical protein [Gammaproteobacteria bacterium]MCP5199181.1 hypothetical protein [Gammaproteobacteria bacterium]